jgi:hypothetical protein
MGYETQLLVGIDTGQLYNEGTFFMLYATIDMCKMGDSALFNLPWLNKTPEKERWYWYPPTGDGNTVAAYEDRYGDIPQPIPIADVIAALEKDIETSEYRRFKWALDMLKALDDGKQIGLSVLMWGH